MKKALIMLMCLLLIVSCGFVGCNKESGDESSSDTQNTTSTPAVTSEYVDENGVYQLANMPEYNYENKEFVVCVISNESQSTYYNEDIDPDLYETTDQAIKDGLSERNNLINQNFGVTVKAVAVKNVREEIKLDIEGNTGAYDAAMPFMCDAAVMAQDDLLYELNEYNTIMHLDAPWYDQLAIQAGSVADQLYFVTGDISMMPKVVTFAITFNKDMMASYYPDVNLYEVVENHEWTYDYMIELSKGVTEEKDGVAGMTIDDQWGLSSSNQDAVTYYLASGEALCTKDSNDQPVLALNESTRSNSVAMHVLETLQDSGTWAIRVEEMGVSDAWVKSLDIFAEGKAMFRTSAFSAIKKLRNYKDGCTFGIVPMPLMDESQSEYYSPSNPQYANVICIPKSAKNPEFSAYMIEAMSCYSKNNVTPEYYETTLKSRDMKDEESEIMLDNYVFKNIVYDVGRIYSFGNVGTVLSTIMGEGNTAIASKMESIKGTIETDIEKCIIDFIG